MLGAGAEPTRLGIDPQPDNAPQTAGGLLLFGRDEKPSGQSPPGTLSPECGQITTTTTTTTTAAANATKTRSHEQVAYRNGSPQ